MNLKNDLTTEETKELIAKGRAERKLPKNSTEDLLFMWEEDNELPEFKFDTRMCDEAA